MEDNEKLTEPVDRNWYSTENREKERNRDLKALADMKALELEYEATRRRVVERTLFGIKISYV